MEDSAIANVVASGTRRRIALRLLPYLFFLYIIAFLDRTNISTAALEIPHELGFSDNVIGVGSGIFFIGYFLLEVPGALIVERWGARRWIARIMITWGLVTIWMAFIHTPRQFYTVRFLLGAAEAGFFPGVLVYLTYWFTTQDRAKAIACFMAAVPASQVLGAPLAGWLLGVHWRGLSGWRWLFVLEGIPAVVMGVVTYFFLTDYPRHAHWLPQEGQAWITSRLENEKLSKTLAPSTSFLEAILKRDVVLLTIAYFLHVTAGFGFIFWLPTIVKRLSGLPNFTVVLIAALPYVLAFLALQFNGWHSDHTGERRWHSVMALWIAAAALLPLIFFNLSTGVTVALLSLVVASNMAFLPSFWPIPSTLLSGSAAAGTIGLINSIGLLGGFAGPALMGYSAARTHSFKLGFLFTTIGLVTAGILMLIVRFKAPNPNKVGSRRLG